MERYGCDGCLSVETHTVWNKKVLPMVAATKHDYDVLVKWLAEI